MYNNSSWDLVDASKKKDFKYATIKTEILPVELRNKLTNEIQKQINSYNIKESKYIADNKKFGNKDNLEKLRSLE